MIGKDHYEKGKEYYKVKDYTAALEQAEKAILLNENEANHWHEKANALWGLKRFEESLGICESALFLDKNHAPSWYRKGAIYYSLKDYEQSLACYEIAIELDGKFASPWRGKGNVYFLLMNYEESLACYEIAIELDVKGAGQWIGKGNVHYLLMNYEESLACYEMAIELDDMKASPWNGKGNIHRVLKDYEQSLTCFEKALELDDMDASTWSSKGVLYADLKDYEQSLTCFEKAIELDNKLADAWNGKGAIYYGIKEYEQAMRYFNRSSFLGSELIINNLVLFSKYPQAPLYCYELLKKLIHPKNYIQWQDLINLTLEQCQPILTYINYLQLIQKDKPLEQWQKWLGIVYYYMGHPLKSYESLKKVVSIEKEDLMSYYYLILSCRGFAQSEEEYLNAALDIAESIKPKRKFFNFLGKNKTYSVFELQQIYYAGQLLSLDNEPAEALAYFESIKNYFLPAAYKCLELKFNHSKEVSTKLAKEIIRAERKVLGTPKSFLSGIPVQNLNLELEDFRSPFFSYARYHEIQKGIGLLDYVIDATDFKNFEPVSPDTLKAFWYTWRLSREQYQQIFKIAKKEGARRRTDYLLKDREQVLGFTAAEVDNLEEKSIEVIDQAESAKLRDAYNNLKTVSPPDELEKQIGEKLNDWTLAQAANYRRLTGLFFLENKLSEAQKIYLDFFSVLQEYAQKKPSDLLIAGEKDIVKALIGIVYDKMLDDEKPMGQLLDVFLKSFAKGSIAELVAKLRKQPNPKFKTYSEFKNSFREFIGEEQKRLGVDFEKCYPLFGFEEWLD